MKKENDEITDLFRTRLADAGMTVRDGFWEELSQDIPVACQHRRRLIFFRVAAAASVLLVLAASSATFWYLSPKEEMEEAFTKIVVANSGRMDGDGVRANQLPGRLAHQSLDLLNIIKAVSHFNMWYGCRYFDESVIHICYCLSDRCS